MTGTAATVVAIIAVAIVGLLMFSGRVPVRRGALTVLGCFVLFGASFIAEGLLNAMPASEPLETVSLPEQPTYTPSVPKPQAYDPYAGASVPVQPPQGALVPR